MGKKNDKVWSVRIHCLQLEQQKPSENVFQSNAKRTVTLIMWYVIAEYAEHWAGVIFKPFTTEFVKWIIPFMNLDTSIIANSDVSE